MLSSLRRIVAASRDGVDEVYRELECALRGVDAKIDALVAWRTHDDRFTCVFASGARYEHYPGALVSAFDAGSPLAEARRRGQPCAVVPPLLPLQAGDRVAYAIPLGDDATIIYLACAAAPRKPVLDEIFAYCEIAAPALQVAHDRAEDRMRARIDGLTGLLTPRAFRAALAGRLRSATRERAVSRIALLFLDTDHFKEWNDRFGHGAGDELLRKLAQMLCAHAGGPEDLVARNGGDEFCLVWANCEKSTAIGRAETLRAAIEESFASGPIAITASIGVAAYPIDAQSAEALLEAADAAMYAAKRSGRNRVAYSEP